MADIIKVDMKLTTDAQRAAIAKKFGPRRTASWLKKLKAAMNLRRLAIKDSFTCRDFSSAVRKNSLPRICPEIA